MKLKKVIKDIEFSMIKGSKEAEILGISSHSKSVAPGFLFIAKRGKKSDGADFIADAILAGAVAVVTDLYNPFYPHIVQLIHPHVDEIEGLLAQNFYKDPSKELFLVGITGTSGKTTTSYIVKHLLEISGMTGLMGTIEIDTGLHRIASSLTTPEITTTNKLLKEMVQYGCKSAVMEVSSIGIDQKRVDRLDFDVAVFTNLTPEHLDYHPTMESYAEVKRGFLRSIEKVVIMNRDSDYYDFMKEDLKAEVITYSTQETSAHFFADQIAMTTIGTTFQLHAEGKSYPIEIPLIGLHNVYNVLAAIAVAHTKGISMKKIIPRLMTLMTIPGRLERVEENIFVDYAHKPDALENVLITLKGLPHKRLILVFGCGGDRDPFKRPRMAEIAEKYADEVIVTSDNPRSEDPKKIIEAIVSGFHQKRFIVEEDRKSAIERAISMAEADDIVLIAGKGHETGQTIGSTIFEFDDRIIAKEMCLSN